LCPALRIPEAASRRRRGEERGRTLLLRREPASRFTRLLPGSRWSSCQRLRWDASPCPGTCRLWRGEPGQPVDHHTGSTSGGPHYGWGRWSEGSNGQHGGDPGPQAPAHHQSVDGRPGMCPKRLGLSVTPGRQGAPARFAGEDHLPVGPTLDAAGFPAGRRQDEHRTDHAGQACHVEVARLCRSAADLRCLQARPRCRSIISSR
jgi:hypothetical protein